MSKKGYIRFFKISAKVLMYILALVFVIVIGLFLYLNTKSGKNFLKQKAENFLNEKLKTRLSVGSIDFRLPNYFELNKVYIEDRNKDTLVYGEKLSVSIALLKLISGETDIKKVGLSHIRVNINRAETDSLFNFQFIIDAFAGNKKPEKVDKDTAAMKLMLRRLVLEDVAMNFNDHYGGSVMYASVNKLDAGLNQFQSDKLRFGINSIEGDGIRFRMLTTKNTESKDTATEEANKLMLTAKKIKLQDVEADIRDQVAGFGYYNNIRTLELSKADVNLANERIRLGGFILANSEVRIATAPAKAEKIKDTVVANAPQWMVEVENIRLDNNRFSMDNHGIKKSEGFDPAHIALSPLTLHADNTFYTADSISTFVTQLKLRDQSGFTLDTLHASVVYTNHQVTANELYVKTPQTIIKNKIQLYFDDIKTLTQNPEKSIVNIDLDNSIIALNDVYTLAPQLKKSLAPEKFRNQLLNVNTQITGTLQRLSIPTLQLTGLQGSAINAKAILLNVTDPKKMMFDVTLMPSTISKNDLAKFVTFTPSGFAQLPAYIGLRATALGSLNDMQADITMSGTNLLADVKATLKNVTDPKKIQYDALIRSVRVPRSLILAFIPKEKLPESIELPQQVLLAGKLSGDVNNILTDIKLGGSYGVITARGYVKNFTNTEKSRYDLKVTTTAFELGKLLKQDTLLSALTMQADIKGNGFDPKTMQADIASQINSIGFKGYDYNNIILNANLERGNIKSTGSVADPNLALNYNATSNINNEYPSGELWLHLDTARLRQLNLLEDTLDIAMVTHIRADNLSPDNLNAFLKIDSLRMQVNNQRLNLDSITAGAKSSNGSNDVMLRSQIVDLNAVGAFRYDQLLPSVMQYINNYYHIPSDKAVEITQAQQIAFNGIIREHPLVKQFVKGLTKYDTVTFKGNYSSNAADSALNFNLAMPYVVYENNKLYNGKISVVSANEQLQYGIKTDTIQVTDTKLYGTQLTGYIAHDSLIADAVTKDAKGTNRYTLGATASVHEDEYILRLKNNLLLNYKAWDVAPENSITYSPRGFMADNFRLGYRQSAIEIQSEQQVPNSPVNISINNFLISDITSLLNKDTLLATGVINGKARISEFEKAMPAFVGNITVDSIYYKKNAIGNLVINTEKASENNISADVALKGNQNDVKLNGNYFLNNTEKQFDANLDIVNFNIASIEGFTGGQIANSQGSIDGKIAVDGKFADPRWNGSIHLKDPVFRLAKFGTRYKIDNQTITLKYPEITLNDFTVQDSANNSLKIDGTLRAVSLSDFGLNLTVNSKNFIIVNTPRATNNLIYGYAALNTDVRVKGTSGAPDIQGTISLNDNTDATVVLPEKNVNKEAAKSVVRFIDRDTFELPEKILFVTEGPEKPSVTTFLNYNLNVELSPKAALTVVIDPNTGDELKIKGDAKLNIGVDPGGNILLAGNYNLDQGHYILHYQFLERKFNLLNGSAIAFGGGPMDAQFDIKAEYTANTSAIDLVGNELNDADNKTAVTFNQKIPFRVLLFLKGTLNNLQVSFDIQLPDENTGLSNTIVTTVENKLAQLRADPAAINKQVFSLLVLNRFVGEQSMDFFKGNGDGMSDIARQSASKFLSAALDQIASDLIKGVDIDLNLNSYKDYSTGDVQQRTDLNIGVSKRFMDDRLSITVGKNLGVEGQDRSAKAGSSYMPDATVNYKLTKDGRYMVRAYSKNKFEVIMDGYVVETGLSFIVSMDYERFNELFTKKRKNRKG